ELAQADGVAARLQKRPQSRRSETLAKRGDHAAGDKDIPRHGTSLLTDRNRFGEGNFPVARGLDAASGYERNSKALPDLKGDDGRSAGRQWGEASSRFAPATARAFSRGVG